MALPVNPQIACPNCGAFFGAVIPDLQAMTECPSCSRPTQIILFPAFDRPVAAGTTAEKVVMDGEATCFYHAGHRAHVPCDACGRFLCALCDLDLNGRHFCPQCLEVAMTKNTVQELERNRTRWDKIIFSLLLFPLLLCYILVPLTSLAALFLIGWKWKAPPSQVNNTRVRLVIYGAVAVLELVLGCTMWWMMFGRTRP